MKTNIEFIDYDGHYPCLCMGTLKVKINGIETIFSDSGEYCEYDEDQEKMIYHKNCYPKFWASGGTIKTDGKWDMWVEQDEWELGAYHETDYSPEILDNMNEILRVFNENVPYGCCGGCI